MALELQRFDGIAWQPQTTLQRYHYDDHGHLMAAENGTGECERYRYRDDGVIVERRLAGGAGFFWEWEGKARPPEPSVTGAMWRALMSPIAGMMTKAR